MLDEGNEREELNLDMAFAPRTQPENANRTGRTKSENAHYVRRIKPEPGHRTGEVQSEQAKKNSRERRKQAEQEYRARRIPLENEQYTKTGHRKVRSKKPGKRFFRLLLTEVFFILLAAILIISVIHLLSDGKAAQAVKNLQRQISVLDYKNVEKPEWEEVFLTPNEYSRPGERLPEVNSIFVHYTANRNTSAAQNRSYFESLKDTHERSASAHFIIGYDGEIIQCIPFEEIAYAVKTRNYDSISIECCYKSADGSFTKETYDSLIHLLAYLVKKYGLSTDDILRHYDCGGKKCPLYYVEHEDDWEQLKRDVEKLLK